jgi:hypothetical protein
MANPWKNMAEFNGNGPEGIEDPSRATSEFRGQLYMVGGSQSGVDSPYDINNNNAAGSPASMDTIWGIKFQSNHLGGDVI